jgi:hypothetical protein
MHHMSKLLAKFAKTNTCDTEAMEKLCKAIVAYNNKHMMASCLLSDAESKLLAMALSWKA